MFKKLVIAVGAAMTLAYALPSSAAPVLDQSFDAVATGSDSGLSIVSLQSVAQTFTVGTSGLLSGVAVQVSAVTLNPSDPPPTADLVFDILPTIGRTPSKTPLASGLVPRAQIPPTMLDVPFVFIDLTAFNIFVDIGDMLAIALSHSSAGAYSWVRGRTQPYSRGAGFVSFPTNTEFRPGGDDLGFQTFVDPDAIVVQVSEPGTIALLGLGLIGIGFARRRMAG